MKNLLLNAITVKKDEHWFASYNKGAATGYVAGLVIIGVAKGAGMIVNKVKSEKE